jgi:hypothetical protein
VLVVAVQVTLIEQISGSKSPALKFDLLLVSEGTCEREIHRTFVMSINATWIENDGFVRIAVDACIPIPEISMTQTWFDRFASSLKGSDQARNDFGNHLLYQVLYFSCSAMNRGFKVDAVAERSGEELFPGVAPVCIQTAGPLPRTCGESKLPRWRYGALMEVNKSGCEIVLWQHFVFDVSEDCKKEVLVRVFDIRSPCYWLRSVLWDDAMQCRGTMIFAHHHPKADFTPGDLINMSS